MRHRYRKDPNYGAICGQCGQGRAEDVHHLMTWQKQQSGNWTAFADGVSYRCRSRGIRTGCYWPEYADVGNEAWIRLGDGVGVSLAKAKATCEMHRSLT